MPISDLVKAIVQIRDVLNDMEVKGLQNSARVVFIHEKCNALIAALNEIVKQAEEEATMKQAKNHESVNGETGETDNEPNQRVS